MRWVLHPDGVRPLGRTIAADAAIALVFVACDLLLHALRFDETTATPSLDFGLPAALVALIIAAHVPLLWRQRAPLIVLVTVAATRGLGLEFFDPPILGFALLATLYAVASVHPLPIAVAALGADLAYEYSLFEIVSGDPTMVQRLRVLVLDLSVFVTPWGLGLWSRIRRQRQAERDAARERERAVRAQQAVADERERMARELHDILAHSISVMVLQASGGREVLPIDRARAGAALQQIEATGRQSMVEVRRLLGLLQDGSEHPRPVSGLARLDALVREVREAGLSVEVEIDGEPVELPPSIDLAAYRIVQEALTNVLKHAPGARATVRLGYRDGVLDLEVSDDGSTRPSDRLPQRGRGLVGMHERVRLVGGELEAGPGPRRGFLVKATLPVAKAPVA